jgi:hypothetical protein
MPEIINGPSDDEKKGGLEAALASVVADYGKKLREALQRHQDPLDVERITHSTIMHRGEPWSVPAPGRHHDVLNMLRERFPEDANIENGGSGFHGKQGFMTNKARFVDRAEGARIAIAAGQILEVVDRDGISARRFNPERLFSEDVW